MYYIEKLATSLKEIAARMENAIAEIHSEAFRKDNPKYLECAQLGVLSFHIKHEAGVIRATPLRYLEEAAPEIAFLERLADVFISLGVDEDILPHLELLAKDARYRSQRSDLADQIREAAGEIREDYAEREVANAITILEAAGFTSDPEDSDIYNRPTGGGQQRIGITWVNKEKVYIFVLHVDGAETLRGKSGEFASLLAAVGITQEVPAK